MSDEKCRAYEVDGEPVRVHGGAPLTDEGQAALGDVVRAAKQLMAKEHPHAGVIQELVAAAREASWCIPNGQTRSPAGRRVLDGVEVKTRLRAAVQAAREALTPAVAPQELAESVHPGVILREELSARGITQTAFAELADRPLNSINMIIKGKKGITANTALGLERALGVSAGFWVRLQAEHDLHVARRSARGTS